MAKKEEEQRKRCTDGIEEVIDDSWAALKSVDPSKAESIVNVCMNITRSSAAKELHDQTVRARQAEAEKNAKEARVLAQQALIQAKKSERADLARRKKEGVSVGMSRDDVLKSNWGKPEQINRTINSFGTHEQWVYRGHHSYLYFEDDTLTSIQN